MAWYGRMESVKVRSSSGVSKLVGVALCLAGASVIAFYAGPSLSPVNHHRAFGSSQASSRAPTSSRGTWITGTFLMVLAMVTWSLWIIMQTADRAAQGVPEQDARHHSAVRVQRGSVVRRGRGGREGLLQVEAPARRQLARRPLHCKNDRLIAWIHI